jgi:hypothetical protein
MGFVGARSSEQDWEVLSRKSGMIERCARGDGRRNAWPIRVAPGRESTSGEQLPIRAAVASAEQVEPVAARSGIGDICRLRWSACGRSQRR